MTEAAPNVLYYGDNLDVLRRHVKEKARGANIPGFSL